LVQQPQRSEDQIIPAQIDFFKRPYFFVFRGAAPPNFTCGREWLSLASTHSTRDRVPLTIFYNGESKIGLKFRVFAPIIFVLDWVTKLCHMTCHQVGIIVYNIITILLIARSVAYLLRQGLKKTAKGSFGGGNTKWEERKLGSYSTRWFMLSTSYQVLKRNCALLILVALCRSVVSIQALWMMVWVIRFMCIFIVLLFWLFTLLCRK